MKKITTTTAQAPTKTTTTAANHVAKSVCYNWNKNISRLQCCALYALKGFMNCICCFKILVVLRKNRRVFWYFLNETILLHKSHSHFCGGKNVLNSKTIIAREKSVRVRARARFRIRGQWRRCNLWSKNYLHIDMANDLKKYHFNGYLVLILINVWMHSQTHCALFIYISVSLLLLEHKWH